MGDIAEMQAAVREFRLKFGKPVYDTPTALSEEEFKHHMDMIYQEFRSELIKALIEGDVVETYDAIIDVMYFLVSMATHAGMELEPGFWEVHGSNMSKLMPDGTARLAEEDDPDGDPVGKIKKGPNYWRPNLRLILEEQGFARE